MTGRGVEPSRSRKRAQVIGLLLLLLGLSGCNLESAYFKLLLKLPLPLMSMGYSVYQTPFAIRHDLRLHQLESAYQHFKHLPGSKLIAQKSFFGNTTGTSNHCEYVLAQLRSFAGSPNTVDAFYANSETQAFQLGPDNPAYLDIETLAQENILKCHLPDESSAFSHVTDCQHWGIEPQGIASQQVYFIKLEVRESIDTDTRCH